MSNVVRDLLSEKLIDDFYAQDLQRASQNGLKNEWMEQLKSCIPEDNWDLIYDCEAHTVDACGKELRRFARFVARLLLLDHAVEADE